MISLVACMLAFFVWQVLVSESDVKGSLSFSGNTLISPDSAAALNVGASASISAPHIEKPSPRSFDASSQAAVSPQSDPSQSRDGCQADPPLTQPKFYSLEATAFTSLDQGSQSAVAYEMEQFIDFYRQWATSTDLDPALWNRRMREFEEELRLQIGPEAMDRIFH